MRDTCGKERKGFCEFLDKEFQSITRNSRTGRRHADKLIKVYLRDGTLLKSLYCKGYRRDDIMRLYHFIDWLMELPKFLEKKCAEEIMHYEEVMTVPHVNSAERLGIIEQIQ